MIIGILKEGMDLINYITIFGGDVGAKGLNPPITTSGKFLKMNTKQNNKLHLNPIEWLFFVINGKPMKSYFKGTISGK